MSESKRGKKQIKAREHEIMHVFTEEALFDLLDKWDAWKHVPESLRRRREESDPDTAKGTPVRLRRAFERLGPVFVKLAQELASRPDLVPPEYIDELKKLQAEVEPLPYEAVRSVIEEELGGSVDELFESLDETPLGAASIGQVHAAVLPDGRKVAVKVRRPGVEELVDLDLTILEKRAHSADKEKWAKDFDLADMAHEFALAVRSEVDYLNEGHNAERFRRFFSDDATVAFPWVDFELSTGKVLVMERMTGIPLNKRQKLEDAGVDTHTVVTRGAMSYFRQFFELGTFHSDPHPGNLLALEDSVIAFLDFGRVSSISERDRNLAAELFVALVQADEVQAADVVAEICRSGPDLDMQGLRADMSSIMGRYVSTGVGDVDSAAAMRDLLEMVRTRGLRMPSEFTMLFNTIGVLQGVVLELDPDLDLTEVGMPYAKKLLMVQLSPQNVLNVATRTLGRNLRVLDRLPVQVGDIMSALSAGKFKVGIVAEKQSEFLDRVQAIVNRASIVFLLAVLAIALAIASVSMGDSTLLANITRFLLFLVLLAGAWLFFSVVRYDYRKSRKGKDGDR